MLPCKMSQRLADNGIYCGFWLCLSFDKSHSEHTSPHFFRYSWWRHQMETSPVLLAICEGNPPVTKASDAELWRFLWFAPEQTVEQTIETPVIWDAIASRSYSVWRLAGGY